MSLAVWVRKNLSGLIHPRVRSLILRHVSLLDKRTEWWISKDPFRNDPPYSTYKPKYPVKLGIIKEFWHRHWPYVAACRDLGVAYELVDISGPDWIEVVDSARCDAFLVWPSVQLSIWKQMYDERLRILTDAFEKIIFPTYEELWIYENKRRMCYWLEANGVPHPKTHVFHSKADALAFVQTCDLPIVAKTTMGARASGVRVARSRQELRRHVRCCFGKGIVHGDGDARDRDRGCVVLQQYIAGAIEWRVLRLGRSYFGHQKLIKGDFHSGSGLVGWEDPPRDLLDFVRDITEKACFTSMDLDVFQTPDGEFLVNELQAIFGSYLPYQMRVNDRPGRYLWDDTSEIWRFEEGEFNQNGSCNLRVLALLDKILAETDTI